jgi:hypothetical protein
MQVKPGRKNFTTVIDQVINYNKVKLVEDTMSYEELMTRKAFSDDEYNGETLEENSLNQNSVDELR